LGYAEIGTNTGHVSTDGTLYDGSWAYHHEERQINWAYRSTHVVAEAGKAITAAYYGSRPRFSYYVGCSGGGRHAAMSAQRYPTDFDGVVAGDPFLSPPGQVIAWNWDEQTLSATPIPPAKLSVIAKAALDECDAKDGVPDRLISDPRRCRFDPGAIACPAGTDRPDCLTQGQVSSLRKF
jgi:feruloyl esterase